MTENISPVSNLLRFPVFCLITYLDSDSCYLLQIQCVQFQHRVATLAVKKKGSHYYLLLNDYKHLCWTDLRINPSQTSLCPSPFNARYPPPPHTQMDEPLSLYVCSWTRMCASFIGVFGLTLVLGVIVKLCLISCCSALSAYKCGYKWALTAIIILSTIHQSLARLAG